MVLRMITYHLPLVTDQISVAEATTYHLSLIRSTQIRRSAQFDHLLGFRIVILFSNHQHIHLIIHYIIHEINI